jgi:hypothetical protein
MRNICKTIFISVACIIAAIVSCSSQPYIDLLGIQFVNSPDYGIINQKQESIVLKQFSVGTTIPIQFKNKADALILSPGIDIWTPEAKPADLDIKQQTGLTLAVSFLKSLKNENWSIASSVIVRRNGYRINIPDNWQLGGAVLVIFKANETLKYKLGVYANKEFFGVFIMPLLGIDWKISNKTNLFGVLPGSLTLEHKLGKKLYSGASFRAITNSYRLDTGYWRINENRLGIFADYYLLKNVVFNAEAGHSVFRKLKTGRDNNLETDWNANDNFYYKVGIAYRLRFR